MNRVIREHYPIENLPEDLRRDLPAHGRVSVEIVLEAPPGVDSLPSTGRFSRFKSRRRAAYASDEAISAHVSALRDEWDRPS